MRVIAEVLRERVTLEVEGIDRMYLNVCVPQLQCEKGLAGFSGSTGDTSLPPAL